MLREGTHTKSESLAKIRTTIAEIHNFSRRLYFIGERCSRLLVVVVFVINKSRFESGTGSAVPTACYRPTDAAHPSLCISRRGIDVQTRLSIRRRVEKTDRQTDGQTVKRIKDGLSAFSASRPLTRGARLQDETPSCELR